LSEEVSRARRAFSLSLKEGFSEVTEEKIRNRRFRLRTQTLGRLGKPLKVLLSMVLMAFLSYIAIVQMKHLFFGTSYFEIRSVELEGNSTIKREDLLRFSGLAPGLNVFSFDRQAIIDRLLQHPWVKSASVALKGLYTVKLTITERIPFLYAKANTSFFEISEDGVILSTDSFGEKEIPIITGLAVDGRQPGESLENNDGFREARSWVNELPAPMLAEFSEIDFSSIHNPYIFLRTGEKLFPSTLDDLKTRIGFLRALLDNLKKNNIEPAYLDLRAPNQIVVKPKKPFSTPERGKQEVVGR